MNAKRKNLAVSRVALAVQGALVAMFAMPTVAFAADDEAADLKTPTNFVEIGVGNTGKTSAKFGEYNGLHKDGGNLIGNFGVRGGDAYGDRNGTMRWGVSGSDLGTTSRSLDGSVSDQGKWTIGIGYDELRHYTSGSYQTPLQGTMGGNTFTLPQAFGVVKTGTITAGVINTGTQGLTANQKSYFHTEEVYSGRKNTKFSAGYSFDPQWSVQFDYNRLTQSGAKLVSSSTDANQSWATVAAQNTTTLKKGPAGFPAGTYYAVENILMLMNPTNYQTDTFTLALNWIGDKGYANGSYYGSRFRDEYNSLNFVNPFISCGKAAAPNVVCADAAGNATGVVPGAAFPINIQSTAPNNDFHQLNLNGGYAFTPATKLAGGLSYGRNTQNDSFVNDPNQMQANGVLPQSSLNGLVVTRHADLKLTSQTTKELMLIAGFKFNERDNRTAANTYNFIDLGDKTRTSVSTPMSNKKTQLELAGDYRIDKAQSVHLGYEYESIKRWCNDALSNNSRSTTAVAGYYTTASCVQSPDSKENKLVANYKLKASSEVSLNAGYAYSRRVADINSSFYNPMQSNAEGYEFAGYMAFFDASRTEQLAKAGIKWQASEKLDVGLNGRYVNDHYDSTLGVQTGHRWSANLDATYNYSDEGTVSAYATMQRRERNLLSGAAGGVPAASALVVPVNTFNNRLTDDDYTLGVKAVHKGMLKGKLDVIADLNYSLGRSLYSTDINYLPNMNTCAAIGTGGQTCGQLPAIRNALLQLKVSGDYKVDKASKVVVGYLHQRLRSNDYYYNGYQLGYTPTGLMPTNEQAPSYSVNYVFAAYNFSFK
jgi:MtrB/PioB family decaheme-associated outer membrane protein